MGAMKQRIGRRSFRMYYKITVLTAVSVIAAAVGAGCGKRIMDRKEALEYALADAGLTAGEITVTRQELEKEDGDACYEIAFTSGEYAYYYEIDASSGAVTGVSINGVSGGGESGQPGGTGEQNGAEQEQAGDGESQSESVDTPNEGQSGQSGSAGSEQVPDSSPSVQESGAGKQPGGQGASDSSPSGQEGGAGDQSASGSSQPGQVGGAGEQPGGQNASGSSQSGQVDTMDSAKAIALADAGLTEEEVTFTKEKLDWDDGVAVYDIDFHTSDMEYEYEINAATGVIMDRSQEVFRNPGNQTGNADSLIGEDRAKEIAVDHAGFSVTEVFFTKIKLEEEHGRMEYEIEFYKDRIEYKFTIDASDGTILEYESEYDD